MVVVFHVEHVPGPPLQLVLPIGEGPLELAQIKLGGHVIGEEAIGALALELNHHVQLTLFLVNIFEGNMEKEAILQVKKNIFKTETGKKLLCDLFL